MVGENLPKRVAVLRNGMLITEGLERLKRFNDFKEFSAVLECTAEKGQQLLRAMEPPRHDAFEPDRLPADRRAHGRTALRELAEWVRKTLATVAKDPVSEQTNLHELADFFGDDEEGTGKQQREPNPQGSIKISKRAVKIKARKVAAASAITEPELDADGDDEASPGDVGLPADSAPGTANDTGANREKPEGASGLSQAKRTQATGLPLLDVRAVSLTPTRRRISFTPLQDGNLEVQLQMSGSDTNHALAVIRTDLGKVANGCVNGVSASANNRVVLEVELDRPFEGTLRVVANAV